MIIHLMIISGAAFIVWELYKHHNLKSAIADIKTAIADLKAKL